MKYEYYAALEALSTGGKTAEEVADILGVEPHDAEAILSALMGMGLVERKERGLIFKREVYQLTEKGWEELYRLREEVKSKLEKAAELRQQGREQEAQEILDPLAPVLPVLLSLGVLDLALYSAALGELAEDIDITPEEF